MASVSIRQIEEARNAVLQSIESIRTVLSWCFMWSSLYNDQAIKSTEDFLRDIGMEQKRKITPEGLKEFEEETIRYVKEVLSTFRKARGALEYVRSALEVGRASQKRLLDEFTIIP